jgi:hypothetical protein
MTERHTLAPQKVQKNSASTTRHNYNDCSQGLVVQALGEIFFDLIMSAIKEIYTREVKTPGHPYFEPKFVFDEDPHVDFDRAQKRFIDYKDFSKEASAKKNACLFLPEYCGAFSNRQYYYIDLRNLKTKYYINISTKQVSGLRWNIDDQVFFGRENLNESGGEKFREVVLDTSWVQENFDPQFLALVVAKAKKEKHRFVKLPIGRARSLQTSKKIVNNPTIAYPQYGMETCAFSSLCSALYFLKFEDVALEIDKFKMQLIDEGTYNLRPDLMEIIAQYVQKNAPTYFQQGTTIIKIDDCDKFDILDHGMRKPNILYHLVIRGDDGSENHAICVVNKWIFDGNFTNALELTKKNLDKCCESSYQGICIGFYYLLAECNF